MRVKLGHLVEQFLVRRRGFLQPIGVLQVTLRVLDRRRGVGRARLLVTGDNNLRVQRCQPVQRRDPILSALGGGVADIHAALVVHNVASDDQTYRWNVERGRIGTIGAALLDDAQFVALESERVVLRLRLCRAIQSPRASASATVVIASTSTASYSPNIRVDVIGSKPSASPKGFGRSPTIAFPGAVKTFTLNMLDATDAFTRAVSFNSFLLSIC